MKKSLFLVAIIIVLAFSTVFVACNDNLADDVGGNNAEILATYNSYVDYAKENDVSPLSYEDWMATIKGEKGDIGPQGPQGEQGLSAYEIFKKHYPEYNGTEEEWIYAVATNDICSLFGHKEEITIVGKLPTNNLEGLTNQISCSVCQEVLQEQKVISAKGHGWMVEDGAFKILLIGNSFTEDASNCGQGVADSQMLSLFQSMLGENVEVTIGVIRSGGKGLNWHATKAENNSKSYELMVVSTKNPNWKSYGIVSSASALEWTDWDAVSIQPYRLDTSNGMESNAYPAETDEKYLNIKDSTVFLLDFIQEHAPQAEVYCYMHWATNTTIDLNAGLSKYNEMADFYKIFLEYAGTKSGKRYTEYIPVGLSIQNARTTYLSLLSYNTSADDRNLSYVTDAQIGLQRDTGHLSFNIGRYIAALTFAEFIITPELRVDNYKLPDIRITESIGELPKEYTVLAQKSVQAAVETWKNGETAVTVIEGYEKDPTTKYAEYFEGGIILHGEITKEKIQIILEEKLYADMILEDLYVSGGKEESADYIAKVTIRYGYTTLVFDVKVFNE